MTCSSHLCGSLLRMKLYVHCIVFLTLLASTMRRSARLAKTFDDDEGDEGDDESEGDGEDWSEEESSGDSDVPPSGAFSRKAHVATRKRTAESSTGPSQKATHSARCDGSSDRFQSLVSVAEKQLAKPNSLLECMGSSTWYPIQANAPPTEATKQNSKRVLDFHPIPTSFAWADDQPESYPYVEKPPSPENCGKMSVDLTGYSVSEVFRLVSGQWVAFWLRCSNKRGQDRCGDSWKPITDSECLAYFAIRVHVHVKRLPSMEDYWTHPEFKVQCNLCILGLCTHCCVQVGGNSGSRGWGRLCDPQFDPIQ